VRAFRFGVQGPPSLSEPAWSDFARRAEDHGYDVLSVADHFDGRPGPLVALAYAAAITDRIRLGTMVLGVDFRNPTVLAQDVATLDELSRERVELGIGAGWNQRDYDATGIPFEPPSVRIDRLAAMLPRLRAALRPSLRLMIGGGGPRMLALAAEEADIVSIVPTNQGGRSEPFGPERSAKAFAAKIEILRAAAGSRFDAVELHTRVFASSTDDAVRLLGVADLEESPMIMVRPTEAMADKLLRQRDRLGISYVTVSARFLDEFAPVVERLRDL